AVTSKPTKAASSADLRPAPEKLGAAQPPAQEKAPSQVVSHAKAPSKRRVSEGQAALEKMAKDLEKNVKAAQALCLRESEKCAVRHMKAAEAEAAAVRQAMALQAAVSSPEKPQSPIKDTKESESPAIAAEPVSQRSGSLRLALADLVQQEDTDDAQLAMAVQRVLGDSLPSSPSHSSSRHSGLLTQSSPQLLVSHEVPLRIGSKPRSASGSPRHSHKELPKQDEGPKKKVVKSSPAHRPGRGEDSPPRAGSPPRRTQQCQPATASKITPRKKVDERPAWDDRFYVVEAKKHHLRKSELDEDVPHEDEVQQETPQRRVRSRSPTTEAAKAPQGAAPEKRPAPKPKGKSKAHEKARTAPASPEAQAQAAVSPRSQAASLGQLGVPWVLRGAGGTVCSRSSGPTGRIALVLQHSSTSGWVAVVWFLGMSATTCRKRFMAPTPADHVSKSLSEMLAAGSLKQVFAPKRIEPRVRRTQYYEGEAWKEPELVPEAKAAPGRAESASFAPKKQEVAPIPQIPLNEIRGVLELVQSPGPGHPTEQRGVAFVSGKWQRLAEPGTPSHEAEPVSLTFTFKEKAKLPHMPQGALQREEQSRSAIKRARLAAYSSKLQRRASGRARLRQVLLGLAAEDAVPDSEECQRVAKIRDRLKACEKADEALLQLQNLAAMPVDAVVLRQTGIGRVVNDVAKAWKGQEAARQTLAAARELVAKWRAMHRQETDAVDDVSADLEKALWEDLVTEDDVDDSDEEYQARLGAVVQALGSADVRQRAMTRSQTRTVVEVVWHLELQEALSAMSSAERRSSKAPEEDGSLDEASPGSSFPLTCWHTVGAGSWAAIFSEAVIDPYVLGHNTEP
ncbi:unnamed protein product, partial [Symbiodinium sp. KB8]